MDLEAQFDGFMEGAPELQLINATDILRSGQNDETLTLKALQFLRYKATHNEEREAKMKLSIIYADGLCHIRQDQREATMWARSVYDKQLSKALAACACFLLDQATLSAVSKVDPFSTLDLILLGSENETPSAAPLAYLAGLLWVRGMGSDESQLERGLACLVKAATDGQHQQAAYELGRIYSDRYLHSLKNRRQSLYWYSKALELGDERAFRDLAYGYYEGDSDKENGDGDDDREENNGDTFIQRNNDKGIDRDNYTAETKETSNGRYSGTTSTIRAMPTNIKSDEMAFKYACHGAKANDRYCQYILGHLYLKGKGTTANAQEAVKWLQQSADQGFTEAIEELATVYLRGVGNVGKDYAKARSICIIGIENDVVFCLAALGDIYRQGWGVERDYHKAFQYYQTAASHNDPYPYAQHMLGEMFLNGEGIPQDLAVAQEWFMMAANQYYEPSKHKLHTLAKSMQSIQDSRSDSSRSNSVNAYSSSPVIISPSEKKSNRWSIGFFNKKK